MGELKRKNIKEFIHEGFTPYLIGLGLAPALEVGIKKAKELAEKFNKKSNSLFNSTYAIINSIGGNKT